MPETDADDVLVVYSDYVCPFCYLGKAAMEDYLAVAEDPPDVAWHPFDLRAGKRGPDGTIDHDVDDGKDEAYFAQVRENVERLQERYDVEMTMDVARDVDSWNAQTVALHLTETQDEDTLGAFHDAVFDALWQDGRDIGDVDVLADVASEVGVPESAVRSAVEDDRLDGELAERVEDARRAGIRAVPTFVYGDHAARGAVPPAQIERLVGGNEGGA